MKYTLLFFMLFLSSFSFAQKGTVTLEEVKDGSTITLIGKNTTDQDQEITLQITSEGLGLNKKETIEKVIPAHSNLELILMTPEAGKAWTYKTALSYKAIAEEKIETPEAVHESYKRTTQETHTKTTHIETSEANPDITQSDKIIVYTKNGCGRCSFVVKYLKENNIPYEELNITNNEKNNKQMSKDLFASGFKGGGFTTPAVVVDGEVFYNIKDLQSFVSQLKK